MRNEADDDVSRGELEKALVRRHCDCNQGEVDVANVEEPHVVNNDRPHPSPHWCSLLSISLVER